MLRQLTKKLRRRTAFVVAILYALCVISPPLALAFTDGTVAAHCLTENHHGTSVPHLHGATLSHDESGALGKSNDHDKAKPDNCCGLFCVTAGAIASLPTLAEVDHATVLDAVLSAAPGGRPSDRIDRPPRTSLSL
jgi:hypothetical protein